MNSIINIYKQGVADKSRNLLISTKTSQIEYVELINRKIGEHEPNFLATEQNRELYKLLALYFNGDLLFEQLYLPGSKEKGSLKKGLLIVGNPGSGKSLAMKSVFKGTTSELRKNSYKVREYAEIKQKYEINGAQVFEEFGVNITVSNGIRRDETIVVLVEDFLSMGVDASYYGNKINIADRLIDLRYEAFTRSHKLTHFTTNVYPSEMKKLLDGRYISRLQEMCNIIEFKDKDWRLTK